MTCNRNTTANLPAGFPSSSTMETIATNQTVVWEEISAIQQAIISASSQCQSLGGQMAVTVAGNTPMTFISGITSVTVTNGGSGYYNDNPSVVFIPPVGITPTEVATGTVITNGGNILSINITNGGLGYDPVPATLSVSSSAGTGAVLQPLVNGSGGIVSINIVNGGTGYLTTDTVIATRAVLPNIAYTNAIFAITTVSNTGEIVEIVVLNTGTGYQPSTTQASIVSTLNNSLPYPLGTGFIGTVLTSDSEINTLGSITGGSGYTDNTYSNIPLIGGTGAGARANITVSSGSVSSVVIINNGNGYVVGDVLSAPNTNLGGTIATLGTIIGGSAYLNGTYTNIPLTGGLVGTGAVADITITSGSVSSITLVSGGVNYLTTDILSATTASLGGVGSGFSVPVATISGTGFSVPVATLYTGVITQVIVNNSGSGYAIDSPYLVISNPGSGASTAVVLGTGATATSVASISVITPGNNYSLPVTGTVFNPTTAATPNPPSEAAVVVVNISENTYGTTPTTYWGVWNGTITNKPIQLQINAVLSYFTSLGYSIWIQTNPASENTIQWQIGW